MTNDHLVTCPLERGQVGVAGSNKRSIFLNSKMELFSILLIREALKIPGRSLLDENTSPPESEGKWQVYTHGIVGSVFRISSP